MGALKVNGKPWKSSKQEIYDYVFQKDFSSCSKDEKLKAGKSWYHLTT